MYIKLRYKNQILCRNLFLFLYFLKNINNKHVNTVSFFIKPTNNNIFTVLRAPYRYKLGRYQYTTSRFIINCTFFILLGVSVIVKPNQMLDYITMCKQFYPFFETNLCYQHKVLIKTLFFFKNNFLIKNYK